MAFHRYKLPFAGLAALILSLGPADAANLAEQGFFAPLREESAAVHEAQDAVVLQLLRPHLAGDRRRR